MKAPGCAGPNSRDMPIVNEPEQPLKLTDVPENVRAYIYRVLAAVVPLLILYGVLSQTEAALWMGVAAAVLSLGEGALASANTPRRR